MAAYRLIIALPLLLLAIACAALAVPRVLQDLEFTAVSTEVSFWGRSSTYYPAEATMADTLVAARRLQGARAGSAEYAALLARVHYWHGQYLLEPEVSARHQAEAVSWQQFALQSRPAYQPGWEGLGRYADAAGDGAASAFAGRQQAQLRLAGN